MAIEGARPIIGIAGEIYQTTRLNVNIVHARCSDGMSDRVYPDKVQVSADGTAEREPERRPRLERRGLVAQDLSHRPVRPAGAVGEAPAHAERGTLGPSGEPVPELSREAALPDARVAEDQRELRLALDGAVVRPAKGVELASPSDEGPFVRAARTNRRERPDEDAAGLGLALAPGVDVP